MHVNDAPESQRLDKWLWVARWFKTRSLAAAAVTGGKVQIEGQRVKPARVVMPGATVHIRKGDMEWEVVVRGVAKHRGPAPQARLLYEETNTSVEQREQARELRALAAARREARAGRPDKKSRRQLARLKRS